MANETEGNPTTQSAGGPGTTIEKFKTADDRDKAYLELEKQNGDQARRLADVEARLEAYASMNTATSQYAPATHAAPQNQSFTDLYPSTKTDDQREAELATRLLTKPSEVLNNVARRVREETLAEVRAAQANEAVVNRFRVEHPDLAKHEEVVAIFVRKQPENLSAENRLKLAIPEARKYLAGIAGNSAPQTTLDAAAYVESPTQRPGATGGTASAEPSDEDELSAMIRERSARQQAKMRV